jgi:hypothetical protein
MRTRSEVLRDNCIRDNRDHKRIKGGAKDCVLFAAGIRNERSHVWRCLPCMTDANDMVHIAQRELEKFVSEDAGSIGEAEQRMIREHCP